MPRYVDAIAKLSVRVRGLHSKASVATLKSLLDDKKYPQMLLMGQNIVAADIQVPSSLLAHFMTGLQRAPYPLKHKFSQLLLKIVAHPANESHMAKDHILGNLLYTYSLQKETLSKAVSLMPIIIEHHSKKTILVQSAVRSLMEAHLRNNDIAAIDSTFNLLKEVKIIPNLKTYTVYMRSHHKMTTLLQVLSIHKRLLADDVVPDMHILNILVRALVGRAHLTAAKSIISDFEQLYGITPNAYVLTSYLTGLARHHEFSMEEVMDVFIKLKNINGVDEKVYNTMLNAFGRRSQFAKMMQWMEKMKKACFGVDAYTYSIIKRILLHKTHDAKTAKWWRMNFGEKLISVKENVLESLNEGEYEKEILVIDHVERALGKLEIPGPSELGKGQSKYIKNVRLAISAEEFEAPPLIKHLPGSLFKDHLKQMKSKVSKDTKKSQSKTSPRLDTIYSDTIQLDFLLKSKQTSTATTLLESMDRNQRIDIVTYEKLIGEYVRDKNTDQALKVFNQMVDFGIIPNARIFTQLMLLSIHTQNIWKHTYRLYKKMLLYNIYPTEEVYEAIIIACSRESRKTNPKKFRQPQKMDELLDLICKLNFPLSSRTYSNMLLGLSHPQFMNKSNSIACAKILEAMFHHSVFPALEAFKSVLNAASWDPTDLTLTQLVNILLKYPDPVQVKDYSQLIIEEYLNHQYTIRIPNFYNSLGSSASLFSQMISLYVTRLGIEKQSINLEVISRKLLRTPIKIHSSIVTLLLEQMGVICLDHARTRQFWNAIGASSSSVPFITSDMAWAWTRCLVWWGMHEEALVFATHDVVSISGREIVVEQLAEWMKTQDMQKELGILRDFWKGYGVLV